ANDKALKVSNEVAQKLLMFMPGDEIAVTGLNVAKVSSLNDWGELQTWEINKKTSATAPDNK
ncbi:Clp protease ClpE, partial [Escherichia coli]